ncbi:tRNA-specific adenosine deaminase [compost metagenome]
MEPTQKNAAGMQIIQNECWMRHAMALAARAEGETGEILVGTVLLSEVRRLHSDREVRE